MSVAVLQCFLDKLENYINWRVIIISMENVVAVEGKALLDVKGLCEYLGIGQTKARELLRGCNGFGIQIGNRWYANKKKLDAWLDRESI